jgi:hypothetical protein
MCLSVSFFVPLLSSRSRPGDHVHGLPDVHEFETPSIEILH